MSRVEMLAARQAALLLHSLPASVRTRVVARLDRSEAATLQPLLDELLRLGVSPELGARLQRLLGNPGDQRAAGSMTAVARTRLLAPEAVAAAVQACSTQTAAQLLRAQPPPWTDAVLQKIVEPRRTEIRRHIAGEPPPTAPAVLELLCERLCLEAARWTP